MPPYVMNASISGILHRLFLTEPQWNPHPWHFSPLSYSILLPFLQMLLLVPAILLICRRDNSKTRILLEWSALLTASLAISTDPASYNFVLMILPACVLASIFLKRKQYGWLIALLVAYIGIGIPISSPQSPIGLAILLYVPRLPLMVGILVGIYGLLWHERPAKSPAVLDWTHYAWLTALAVSLVLTARSTFIRERAVRREYAYRLPLPAQGLINLDPRSADKGIQYITFTLDGYHLVTNDHDVVGTDSSANVLDDDLSFATGFGNSWVERAQGGRSEIIDTRDPSHVVINDARDPMLSEDGQSLAYVRDNHGRGRLMLKIGFRSNTSADAKLTRASLNVYDASFLSGSEYAFSAVEDHGPPQIYLTDATHANERLELGESRYPALSPDRRWMAYSHFEHGAWNLWIRNQKTGATQRISAVPCNQFQSSWESDSKTLLYGTDCGRSLWFTAIARRKVIP